MKDSNYKAQFVEFIASLYPHGLPEGINCVVLSCGNDKRGYRFVFDREDVVMKKNTASNELNQKDIDFLKRLKITV